MAAKRMSKITIPMKKMMANIGNIESDIYDTLANTN
jgi:hypothetical protein